MAGKNFEDSLIVPGIKPVTERIIAAPATADRVYIDRDRKSPEISRLRSLCEKSGVKYDLVEAGRLEKLCRGAGHQGVVLRLRSCSLVQYEDLLVAAFEAPVPLIVALDGVLDPGNVGTLARTLYALGAAGIVFPRHNSAYLGPGAMRSSAGALSMLPIAEVTNLAMALRLAADSGYAVYGADADGENCFEAGFSLPAILVLGSEENGIRPSVRSECSSFLAIPFGREFDSLNVAQAGAILASCFVRAAARRP